MLQKSKIVCFFKIFNQSRFDKSAKEGHYRAHWGTPGFNAKKAFSCFSLIQVTGTN